MPLPPLANFKDESGNEPRTLVLVIGESTQRGRMSLYGYPRETTPELDALHKTDPNLTVFNNVVTSRPYTIEILQQALTFANEKNPDLYLTQPSLMNMMKQAGYKNLLDHQPADDDRPQYHADGIFEADRQTVLYEPATYAECA